MTGRNEITAQGQGEKVFSLDGNEVTQSGFTIRKTHPYLIAPWESELDKLQFPPGIQPLARAGIHSLYVGIRNLNRDNRLRLRQLVTHHNPLQLIEADNLQEILGSHYPDNTPVALLLKNSAACLNAALGAASIVPRGSRMTSNAKRDEENHATMTYTLAIDDSERGKQYGRDLEVASGLRNIAIKYTQVSQGYGAEYSPQGTEIAFTAVLAEGYTDAKVILPACDPTKIKIHIAVTDPSQGIVDPVVRLNSLAFIAQRFAQQFSKRV